MRERRLEGGVCMYSSLFEWIQEIIREPNIISLVIDHIVIFNWKTLLEFDYQVKCLIEVSVFHSKASVI
jgi:hypothetical protein